MVQTYRRPKDLEEARELLTIPKTRIVAGGTDLYPNSRNGQLPARIVDLTAIESLRGVSETDDCWRIGATTVWRDIAEADWPVHMRALSQAAAEVGGWQIQNAGTIAGNLCNASPAADGVPALMVLDAHLEIDSDRGQRKQKIADFLLGNRRTDLADDECVTAIVMPKPKVSEQSASVFLKLGSRRHLVISIVMVAACLQWNAAGKITHAAVSVGACSPVALRLPALESRLLGKDLTEGISQWVQDADLSDLAPISDCRAGHTYRLDAAFSLVVRALEQLVVRAIE